MLILRDAYSRIINHKARSLLVTLTFVLGLSSVISIVGTIEGGRRAIEHDLEALGSDLIALVNPLKLGTVSMGIMTEGEPITSEDLVSLRSLLEESVDSVSPLSIDLGLTTFGDIAWRHTMVSTTPGFRSVLRSGLLAGRYLEETDRWPTTEGLPVPTVIDEALALKFFYRAEDAMGKKLRSIRNGKAFDCEIIGVVKDPLLLRQHLSSFDATSKARSIPARRLEFLNLYMPWRAESDQPAVVIIDSKDVDRVDQIEPTISEWIGAQGKGVYLHVQKDWTRVVLEMVDRFRGLGHFIWVLDLVIVLILTATISLLAIDESMGEVALRRAEGARVFQVTGPVFLEAGILALIALLPGYYLGLKIIEIGIVPVLGWQAWLPPTTLFGTFVALVLTAMLSAVLPAWRVATMDPATVLCGRRDL
ncbi:MAG: hypothetical protein CBC13_11395 [Planctomycetia bacterium TMED53]|nr:MAG: hypothetical protein CBC13_11395 [Planctomycetia bacterium TMED53]